MITNILSNIWPVLMAIYIISPFDAHPLFMDDLIAAVALFYFMYKNSRRKKNQQQYSDYFSQSQSNQSRQTASDARGPLTLNDAYSMLGVTPNDSLDAINKAYRDKMTKSHPDKVSHLSEELQETAKELTLQLNEAMDLIRKHKKA